MGETFSFSEIEVRKKKIYEKIWQKENPKTDAIDLLQEEIDELHSLLYEAQFYGTALVGAVQWLLDDMNDAGETRDKKTGTVYDSVQFTAKALKECGGKVSPDLLERGMYDLRISES